MINKGGFTGGGGYAYVRDRLGVVSVKDFGAKGDGITDDTAAIQAAIDAASPLNATVYFSGPSLISAALKVPTGVTIQGTGSFELYGSQGSATSLNNSINLPTESPYLTGAVLIQSATDTNILEIEDASSVINLFDFGMLFASPFANTGHAIYAVPPTIAAGGYDNGWMGFKISNIKVYGHDGDHYAIYAINPIYGEIEHFLSWGGGIYYFENNSNLDGHYGNLSVGQTYGKTIVSGTAHGIRLKSSTSELNEMAFYTCQLGVVDMSIPGVTPPTDTQYTLYCDTDTVNVAFSGLALETNVGAPNQIPDASFFIDPSAYIADNTSDASVAFPLFTSFAGVGSSFTGTRTLHSDMSLKLNSFEPSGSVMGWPLEPSGYQIGQYTDGTFRWRVNGPSNQTMSPTTLEGTTAGSILYSMLDQGSGYKRVFCLLQGYENTTSTAQTITFPVSFSNGAAITSQPSAFGATVSTTELTLPASMTGAVSGVIVVEGI